MQPTQADSELKEEHDNYEAGGTRTGPNPTVAGARRESRTRTFRVPVCQRHPARRGHILRVVACREADNTNYPPSINDT